MNKTISYKESTASTPGKPNTPGKPTTPKSVKKKGLWGMLPQTGEAKSIMALLGIGIICLVVLVSVERRNYKEDAGIAVNAMMASAINDPYVDLNPPSKS